MKNIANRIAALEGQQGNAAPGPLGDLHHGGWRP